MSNCKFWLRGKLSKKIPLKKRIIYYLADRWLRGDAYFYENYGPTIVKKKKEQGK